MKRKGMGVLKFEIVLRALERFRVRILERMKCLFGLGKRILRYIFSVCLGIGEKDAN